MLLTDDFIEEMIVDTEELVHPDEVRPKKKKIQFIKKKLFHILNFYSVKHYAIWPLSQFTYNVDLVLNTRYYSDGAVKYHWICLFS